MKQSIRREMRVRNLEVDSTLKETLASQIFSAIETSEIFASASTIALYASLRDELPTKQVIQRWCHTKKILLPKVGEGCKMEFYDYNPSLIGEGAYGISEPQGGEPIPPSQIDIIIVPGVAFTLSGARLGRGKGYYDRYLAREGVRAHLIGVCYPHQILDSLPIELHDRTLHEVINL